jgi:hypothetical protein
LLSLVSLKRHLPAWSPPHPEVLIAPPDRKPRCGAPGFAERDIVPLLEVAATERVERGLCRGAGPVYGRAGTT